MFIFRDRWVIKKKRAPSIGCLRNVSELSQRVARLLDAFASCYVLHSSQCLERTARNYDDDNDNESQEERERRKNGSK